MKKIIFTACLAVSTVFGSSSTASTATIFDQLTSHFYVHDCFDVQGKPIEQFRFGKDFDGGYIVDKSAVESSDVMLGYGIARDNSFELSFCDRYNKPAFGFDGSPSTPKAHPLFTFVPEFLGTTQFAWRKDESTTSTSSFQEQMDRYGLHELKKYIKMDIEGAEYQTFPEILKYASTVTGIVLEIHGINAVNNAKKALSLIEQIEENFILTHIHGNNAGRTFLESKNVKGQLSNVVELTFIHKNLVSTFSTSENQSHPTELDQPNLNGKEDLSFELLKK